MKALIAVRAGFIGSHLSDALLRKGDEEVFTEGDSWLIPGFVPHGFYSPQAERPGRILALTFGQHLTGDARQELSLLGRENLARIVSDTGDDYPKSGPGSSGE